MDVDPFVIFCRDAPREGPCCWQQAKEGDCGHRRRMEWRRDEVPSRTLAGSICDDDILPPCRRSSTHRWSQPLSPSRPLAVVHASVSSTTLIPFMTSLLALLNPLADFALFLSLTSGRSKAEQRQIAVQAAIAIAVIMIATLWLGDSLLTAFGISIGAFSVAGGIILFGIGLGMLNSKSGESSKAEMHKANIAEGQRMRSPAVVPLGIPISAGPGVITALLVSAHSNTAGVAGLIAFSLVCVALSALMGLVFWMAPLLGRLLGDNAMHISTQVMGLVVAAIASQMVLNGLRAAFPVLTGARG